MSHNEKITLLEKLAKRVAWIHDYETRLREKDLERIRNPQIPQDHALAAFVSGMSSDEIALHLVKEAISGTLHDLFFFLQEEEGFKLVMETSDGAQIDLAEHFDVLHAKPGEWIEGQSRYWSEESDYSAFLTKYLDEHFPDPRKRR